MSPTDERRLSIVDVARCKAIRAVPVRRVPLSSWSMIKPLRKLIPPHLPWVWRGPGTDRRYSSNHDPAAEARFMWKTRRLSALRQQRHH